MAIVALTPLAALASFFGGPYADSSVHTHVSTESNSTHKGIVDPKWQASMDHLEAATDMTTSEVAYSADTDAYWYVASSTSFASSSTLADATCMDQYYLECYRFRVRFNEAKLHRTSRQIRHTACHEISHTLGSDDGASGDGCFPQSIYSDDIHHNSHERGHIDARY